MQSSQLITELLGFGNILYAFAKPIIVLQVFAFLLLARTFESSKDPWKLAQAFFCYIMEIVGIVLMSIGALPTIMAVLGSQGFSPDLYLGLLLVFAAGGILFLWIDQFVRNMDKQTRLLPELIFVYTIKTFGYLSVIFAVLSLSLSITSGALGTPGWWIVPLVTLAYGMLLSFLTSSVAPWQAASPAKSATTKKAAAKKKTAAKKKR